MDDRTRAQYDEMLRQVSGYDSVTDLPYSVLKLGLQARGTVSSASLESSASGCA